MIERPTLEAALGEAIATRKVVLIAAPAGFGKTVALTRQLARLPQDMAFAWVDADEADDAQRLLACLVAALEPFDVPWRMAPEALIAAAQGPLKAQQQAAATVVNALAATEVARGLIVFDDLHRLGDPAAFELLERLIERLPRNWSVVLAGRMEPALPLARWRALGELAEFRHAELRFGADEVRALVAASGSPIDEAAELLERTQGWAAGLRLSLSTPASGAARASHPASDRHVFDFLAAEVLDGMDAALREFLLCCAVLPELTAGRCAAVCEDARAAQWLERIDRDGLFVTRLDADELTLRLHDLFRDFLLHRLQRERPGLLPQLYRRAAGGERDPVRRVGLLAVAGAWDEAQQTLAAAAPLMLAQGDSGQVLRLVGQFPAEMRERSPVLALVRGMCAWPHWEWTTMQAAMQQAADGFEAMRIAAPPGEQDALLAQIQRVRAFEAAALSALGRFDEARQRLDILRAQPLEAETAAFVALVSYWEAAACGPRGQGAERLSHMLDLLEAGASAQLWYRCIPHYLFTGVHGMREPMERFGHRALQIAGSDEHAPLAASARCVMGWLALWRGRADEAQSLLREVQREDRWLGQPRVLRLPLVTLQSTLCALRGEREACWATWRELEADIDGDSDLARRQTWRGAYLANMVRLAWLLDDAPMRDETMRELLAYESPREWPFMRPARLMLRAQLALHEGRPSEAMKLLEQAVPLVERNEALGFHEGARVLLALAHRVCGNDSASAAALAPVVEQVIASGEIGGLLMIEPGLLEKFDDPILRRAAALSRSFRVRAPAAQRPPGLSERETEVLERIAAGDSNKLIARVFELSPHTVKRHVANILDKLGLESRGQAAAWYRQHAAG